MGLSKDDWLTGALCPQVESATDEALAEWVARRLGLVGSEGSAGAWPGGVHSWPPLLLSLLPGCYDMSSFSLARLSTLLFLPWSQPRMG